MNLSIFEATWFVLLFTVLGTLFEVLYKDRIYGLISFFFSSLGVVLFSLSHVSLCSDYSSYKQIYTASLNGTTTFIDVIGLDKSYQTLAGIWGSLVAYLKLDFILGYNLFTALYQTTSILLLILFLFFFFPKWKNTILFFILFGSLQFQHIIVCGIRSGLSSSLTILLFFTYMSFMSERRSTNKNNKSFLPLVFLALLSAFAHWQAAIAILIIAFFEVIMSKSFTLVAQAITLGLFTRKITLVLLFTLTGITLYFYPQIFSSSVLSFSAIFLQAQYQKISLYLDEGAFSFYGTRLSVTFYIELVIIYLYFKKEPLMRMIVNKEKSQSNSLDYAQYKLLAYLGYLSFLNLIVKLLLSTGLGVLLRVSVVTHLLQIFCLPVLLDSLKMRSRVILVLLMSLPYLYFIFFVSKERFLRFL